MILEVSNSQREICKREIPDLELETNHGILWSQLLKKTSI